MMTEESQDSKQQVTEKLYKHEKGTKLEAVEAFIISNPAPSDILPLTRLHHIYIPKQQRGTSVQKPEMMENISHANHHNN